MKVTVISAVWCNACLVMKKIIKEIEKKYEDIEFIKYDYDIDEDIVKTLNVGEVLPVFIFEKDSKEVRLTGEKNKEEIINVIEEMVK